MVVPCGGLRGLFLSPPPKESEALLNAGSAFSPVSIPEYLQKTYWWAYLHPNAVRIFERQWLVNLILWGNFSRLRNAALQELGQVIDGKVLQVACVYGDFTEHLVRRLGPQASLDVVDVAPIPDRLKNTVAKTKHQKVLDGFFGQVMIDSIRLGFVNHAGKLLV